MFIGVLFLHLTLGVELGAVDIQLVQGLLARVCGCRNCLESGRFECFVELAFLINLVLGILSLS